MEWRFYAWKLLPKMNTRLGIDEDELLQLVTTMETPTILVVILKGVAFTPKSMAITMGMRYHGMWLSTLKTIPTKEASNIVTCAMT